MTSSLSLALLLWHADLAAPQRSATPWVMAQAAAALDAPVEIYFTAASVHLLTPAAQTVLIGFGDEQMALSAHLHNTAQAGVKLYACTQALRGVGLTLANLVPQCSGPGGAVQFMARAIDPNWRTLVF